MATILAIESSCDETSVAIIRNGKLLSNAVATQIAMHRKYGGVMPEIASRLHNENIVIVLNEALKEAKINLDDVDAIAVTRGPGLIGALHVGLQAAKTLSLIYNIPLIPVHHLAGHIYAGEFVARFKYPLLSLVVSGGNTELVYMEKHLDFKIIGETKDDAIGECFDKVARTLGLPYPGGLPIDQHAKLGKHTYKLPTPLHGKGYDFSYSGLKTSVINIVNQEKMKKHKININDMCRSFEDTAVDMVVEKTIKAAKDYNVKQIVLAGGVSANSYLRSEVIRKLKNSGIDLVLPPIWCTTDNAAMIAKIGEHLYKEKLFAKLDLGVDPNWKIDKYRVF
ncbi:MAG: tRNA (adenosine(37)-N6)-threonylcarbamoyltransferase complex transferase subunit TsaD [Bacilli bacterium]|nr:tRNA (adenosine(37)-N6)-threonylcarbamoyltransferase complex transferase subunit TsaD [Bacilli bacterium]